ncbi:beta-glucosidase [Aspergillus steynii IBT 23096]|uniref:Beta-glucosidase n=1 Tax=Aspergillus steynii IBT 23096 TaxID=1392250 RepID=A0A2I2FWJ5_9EURO|nr:beta-glucosidase [Aspergillus steynii IBT 23096]PLB44985.1 beta-glucosidase [Aspergillus steynii IBT 23096]
MTFSKHWLAIGSLALEYTLPALAIPQGSFSPQASYSSFQYTPVTSDIYATPLPSSLSFSTPYAPPFSEASTLLPDNLTTTTYSYNPAITPSPDGQHGQSAYAALWKDYSYTTTPPFTTTASATPVAKAELVLPPQLYNAPPDTGYRLPKDFIWGVSSSAWQIEGGIQLEGRGPGSLDDIGNALSSETASLNDSNVANMHYFLYKQDIARLAAIGIPYYSFSISWSRIVPFGVAGSPINKQGLDHYNDLINTCLEYGITPIVTLNHADMPTSVTQDIDSLPSHFLYYAKVAMTHYSDRVPYWVTFNEPNIAVGTLFDSYSGLTQILLAHADAYRWYKDTLRGTGQITIKFANNLGVPLSVHNTSHVAAASRYQNFLLGILSNPLFLGKQYPEETLNRNTNGTDLTPLTDAQIAHVHGTVDFWSFDPYTAQFVSPLPTPQDEDACHANSSHPAWPTCVSLTNIQANGWAMGQPSNDYAYIAPHWVRQQLGYVWNTFKPSGILIAEYGFNPFEESKRSLDAQRYDLERALYYEDFLRETLKAMYEDGVNVIGALAWSFQDNNEFGRYGEQYGLQTVNRTDSAFTRTYKRSIFDYVSFFHKHVEKR